MEGPSGPLIALAVTAALVVLGASLFRVQVDILKVLLSCLAAAAASFMIALVVSPTLGAAAASIFAPAMAIIVSTLLMLAVSLLVLGACLVLITEVSVRMGWALAFFATGGSFVVVGLYYLYAVGRGIVPPIMTNGAWGLIIVGGILSGIGYWMGRREMEQAPQPRPVGASGPAPVGPVPDPVLGGGEFRRTVAPVSFAAAEGGPGRPTESHNPTILHEEKLRPAATGWLVVSIGQEKGKRFDLRQGDTKIGRSSQCEVRILGDDEISREHCLIRVSGQQHQLYDLASRNCTYLNDSQVREARTLRDGDLIRVGNTVLSFKQVE
jgi:hypothetical protein